MHWGGLHLYNEIFEIRNLKGIFFLLYGLRGMKQCPTSKKHGGISLPNSGNQEANREGKEVSRDKTYFSNLQ